MARGNIRRVDPQLGQLIDNYYEYVNSQLEMLGINKRISRVQASRLVAKKIEKEHAIEIQKIRHRKKNDFEVLF